MTAEKKTSKRFSYKRAEVPKGCGANLEALLRLAVKNKELAKDRKLDVSDEKTGETYHLMSDYSAAEPGFVGVRGLGLLLYGLLRNSFELPSMWNGSGHADVLGMLPKLLLDKMTCSSWTLGVLQGCLMPRVTENLFIRMGSSNLNSPDNDMLRDPFAFLNATALAAAIRKCQEVLETHQLSTLEHKARQLIPISIKQLTTPEWSSVFGDTADEGRGDA